MKFEDSVYYKELNTRKLTLPFGDFYLADKMVIGEFFEGQHVDWDKIECMLMNVEALYDKNTKLAYISHRINDYSINPQIWTLWEETFDFVVASAIIIYNNATFMNASIEKHFAKKSLKRCTSLDEGICWVKNLKEFKKTTLKS
ncbi:hypothetical protein [Neotamlana laminarinivorans]|uniref:Uncharacterized protein n=1 Tax=Neotamlana laminarinivorans TaxID=2883124 RepID=A0A9X1HWB8_9FLAO|nr:hypothetical protein [Tamlana laminarinivorans]MCB4797363.1 hypothetical protein [Tamlana laminarinivorans]